MSSDDSFLGYIASHVQSIAASLDPEATARDLMRLPSGKRAEYLRTLQEGIDNGLITTGGLSGYDYPTFWCAVLARVAELESEGDHAD